MCFLCSFALLLLRVLGVTRARRASGMSSRLLYVIILLSIIGPLLFLLAFSV